MKNFIEKLRRVLPGNILGAGLIAMIIKLMGAIVAYGMIVAFAHFLSPDEYGRFAFGLNAAVIVSVTGGFGFTTGILRYWPKYFVAQDFAGARGVVRLGYSAVLFGALMFTTAAFCYTLYTYFRDGEVKDYLYLTISVLAVILGLCDYSTNLLRAQGSVVVSMLPRDVLWRVFSVAAAGMFFWYGVKLSGPQAVLVSAFVLVGLVTWQIVSVHRHMNFALQSQSSRNDWKLIAKSISPIWASSIIIAMIQQFDVIIVGAYLSNADVGAYFAAQKTAALLSLVLIVAGLVMAPTMSGLYNSNRQVELQRLCRNLAGLIAIITAIGFCGLVFFGHELLRLFDDHFVSAYPILIIVALGTMIDAVSGPNAYLMQMTNYEGEYLKIMTVCYAAVLIAQLILIPKFGGVGAAAASAGGVVVWNIWAITVLRRKAGFDPSLLSLVSSPKPQSI